MSDLEHFARVRNTAFRNVRRWMEEEAAKGNLRENRQAPAWAEYQAAENALQAAILACGILDGEGGT